MKWGVLLTLGDRMWLAELDLSCDEPPPDSRGMTSPREVAFIRSILHQTRGLEWAS